MASSKKLLAIISVLLAIGQLTARAKELDEHCKILRNHLVSRTDLHDDPTGTMEFALEHMPNFGMSPRAKLAYAWKKIIKAEDCSASSLNYIVIIAKCSPDRETLGTLISATERYANKCLTPEYIGQQIRSAIEGPATNGANEFVDDEFIANYRQMNPNEPRMHFAVILGDNCCQPNRSAPAMVKALEAKLAREGKHAREHFKGDAKALESHLKSNLFNPCKSYATAVENLMSALFKASQFYEGGERAMLDSLDLKSQNAIFRFKFCEDLEYESDRKRLVALVAEKLDE